MPIAEKYSLPIKFLLIVKAVAFTVVTIVIFLTSSLVHRFFFWDCDKKNYSILNYAIICLIMSGLVCSLYIDELFWGGSLDWICLSWISMDKIGEDYSHRIMRHFVFDFKDIYFVCGMILFVARVSLFNMTYIKASAFERKGFSAKIKHPISNIRRMVSSSQRH